jgi:hypothetical protein
MRLKPGLIPRTDAKTKQVGGRREGGEASVLTYVSEAPD